MLFKSRWHSVLITVLGVLALSACVNEEYDLSEELDKSMTLLRNVSLPIGSVEKISIGDILTLEEDETSVISKNADGDYIFSFGGDDISADIEVPSFSVAPADGIHTEPVVVVFPTGVAAGKDAAYVFDDIVYSKMTGKPLDAAMDIEISSELPSQIMDIRSVGLDALVKMNFSVDHGFLHIKEGFTIDFPEYLHLMPFEDVESGFEVVGNHKIVFKEDIKVSATSPIAVSLKLDKINVSASAINNGKLVLNESVHVGGDFYLSPSDYVVIPEELVIDIKADIIDLDVLSAEVKLALDERIDGSTVSIDGIPEFLGGDNVCLDLYNPAFKFDFVNSTPFSFAVKAGIKGIKGTNEVAVSLGKDPGITLSAQSTSRYLISRREYAKTEGVRNIVIPEIGDMISMLPEVVSIEDIVLTSADTDYVTISSGSRYQASVGYEVYAPLAFDKDLALSFNYDITDLGLDLASYIPSVAASLTIENSVPLEFGINAQALDSEGKVINDIEVTVSKSVAAGSHKSPATTDVALSITGKNGSLAFDGLRLAMKASSSSESAGITLNENQGFAIKNLVITLPEGITITDNENE